MALKEVLRRNRLQQTDLAEAIGVSKQTVWLWCNGEGQPMAENLLKARDWIRKFEPDVTADELLTELVDCPAATVAPITEGL